MFESRSSKDSRRTDRSSDSSLFAASAASSSSSSASSAIPVEPHLTLQDFGVAAGKTVQQLQQEHGSFQLLAWFGDHLLERFVTDRIWMQAMGNASDAGASASSSPVSPQWLHDQRVRFTSNTTLTLYLKYATDIRLESDPSGNAPSEHAWGTLFEFLLCLAHRSPQGLELVRQRVHAYMDWVMCRVKRIDATLCRVQSMSLKLSWSSEDPGAWSLYSEDDLYESRKLAGSKSHQQRLNLQTSTDYLLQVISKAQTIRQQQRKAAADLSEERRRLAAEMVAKQRRLLEKVQSDPFCNVEVPVAQTAVMDADMMIRRVNAPSAKHTGKVVDVRWRSRSKHEYTEPFWDCCGMRKAERRCNKPNWPHPNRYHPGSMLIPTGTNKHRQGGGVGENITHIPVGRFPDWSCCKQTSITQGCRNPAFQSSTSSSGTGASSSNLRPARLVPLAATSTAEFAPTSSADVGRQKESLQQETHSDVEVEATSDLVGDDVSEDRSAEEDFFDRQVEVSELMVAYMERVHADDEE